MSNALIQLRKKEFECPESIEISEYIQSILTPETTTKHQEDMISYVVSVPFLIERIWQVATERNEGERIKPILESIRNYFFNADDLIPDHHGVIGLLDDTYMAYCFINELNQLSIHETGASFVELNLDYQKQLIAINLGADIAQQIEADVKSSMDGSALMAQLKTAGTLMVGGLLAGFLINSLSGSGGQSNSDQWSELFNNSIDHGW